MTEEEAQGIESGFEHGGLHDHIGHWVKVLDRWVKELDKGMGRDGVDIASEPAVEDAGVDS